MKPFEGKRMDSAMRPLRFSRAVVAVRGLRIWMDRGLGPVASDRRTSLGRESTSVGTGPQRFREGRSGRLRSDCYSPVLSRLGPDRGGCSTCLFWLGSRPSGRLSNAVDCLQCSATAAGRWGGDLVPCAKDVGGHMGPSDPSWNTDQGV